MSVEVILLPVLGIRLGVSIRNRKAVPVTSVSVTKKDETKVGSATEG